MALKYVSTITTTTQTLVGDRGQRFAIQPDVAVYVAVGDSTITASATNGILVSAGGLYEDVIEDSTNRYVSVKEVSGSFNAKLFRGT